jgi:hypothetical protein
VANHRRQGLPKCRSIADVARSAVACVRPTEVGLTLAYQEIQQIHINTRPTWADRTSVNAGMVNRSKDRFRNGTDSEAESSVSGQPRLIQTNVSFFRTDMGRIRQAPTPEDENCPKTATIQRHFLSEDRSTPQRRRTSTFSHASVPNAGADESISGRDTRPFTEDL